jgi:hypothetical protein
MKRFLAVGFLLLAASATTTGCGGSTSQQEKQFVAALNTICHRPKISGHDLPKRWEVEREWRAAQGIAALLSANRGLPRVAKLAADLASARAEPRASAREHIPFNPYASDVRIYEDEKALGLSCGASRPPKPPEG